MRRGQALVEVMLALAITGITLMAVVRLSTRSVTNSNISRDSTDATLLAREGMEWVKQQRLYDATYSSWNNFIALSGGTTGGNTRVYCLNSLSWASVLAGGACSGSCADAAGSIGYRREATVTSTSANAVNVQVNVYKSGTCTSHIDLNTVFTNYQ